MQIDGPSSTAKSCCFLLGCCLCILAGTYLALCIATHETPVVATCALIKAFDAKTDVSKVPCPEDAKAKLRSIVHAKSEGAAAAFKGDCFQAKCFVTAYFSSTLQAKKVDTDASTGSIVYEGKNAVVCGPSSAPKDVVESELQGAAEAGVNRTCFFFPETKRHRTRVTYKDPGNTFKRDLLQGWELFLLGLFLVFFFEVWAYCKFLWFPCAACCGCADEAHSSKDRGEEKSA